MSTFTYFGEEFHFSPEVDEFALTEFAEAFSEDADSAGLRGIAVAWRLALSCVAEDEQAKFRAVSRKNKATTESYLRVFRDRMAQATERPTGQPTDSSAGLSVTERPSEPQLTASVTPLVRPDLALLEARSRASA